MSYTIKGMVFYISRKTDDILKLTGVSLEGFFKQVQSMLGIENTILRSVPEYRHQFARSLAENLFLINSHRGREAHREIQME